MLSTIQMGNVIKKERAIPQKNLFVERSTTEATSAASTNKVTM